MKNSPNFHLCTPDRELRDRMPTHSVLAKDLEIGDILHDDHVTWTIAKRKVNDDGTMDLHDSCNNGYTNCKPDLRLEVLDPYCVSNTRDQPTYAALVKMLRKCRPFVWRAMMAGKVPHAQDKIDAEKIWPDLDAAIKKALSE